MLEKTYTTNIEPSSRFKDTTLSLLEIDGETIPYFNDMIRPEELNKMKLTAIEYTVEEKDVGRLDLIAVANFDDPTLWPIIALLNDEIIDPIEDMYPGQKLLIPSRAMIYSFVNRSPRA